MSFDYKKIGLISGILLLLCALYVTLTSGFSLLALSNALFYVRTCLFNDWYFCVFKSHRLLYSFSKELHS